ncbi:twin-arginine translocation pathway signal protein [Actinokineospora inagensis]|uniref:dioxygenase family protein n=1 Tax=Actinokineospora inagensis TaxID=103730 RepID=UPI000413C763|nr:twin-arginine translocation pathway signal protein [Actinokineospora inagensis]
MRETLHNPEDHDDDEPVGRVLGRRQALALLGLAGAAITVAGSGVAMATTDSGPDCPVDCIAKPEQVEGPYFVDEQLNRSDIRTDPSTGVRSPGTPLALGITVLSIKDKRCVPLKDAVVDIWHCDAAGKYSDFAGEGTAGKKFLRGLQVTNRGGQVRFTTILPGWYRGRAIHIHVKIRTTGTDGKPYEFTSQLYFTDEFTAAYLADGEYKARGPAETTDKTDFIYLQQGGDQMLLHPRRSPVAHTPGYAADFTIALDLADPTTGDDDSQPPFPPTWPPTTPTPPPSGPSTTVPPTP